MDRSNRLSVPRHDILLDQCFEASDRLKLTLGTDINSIRSNSDNLKEHVRILKEHYKTFSKICHDSICSSYKIGARSEGNDLKTFKFELKQETEESIALVLGYLNV